MEISGTAGWTFSDGVNVERDRRARRSGSDPKDAFSWGARLGFIVSRRTSRSGVLFDSQTTDLEATGIVNISVPQSIYNYHGYFAYNFGDADAKARPYFLGGLGRDAVRRPRHRRRGRSAARPSSRPPGRSA